MTTESESTRLANAIAALPVQCACGIAHSYLFADEQPDHEEKPMRCAGCGAPLLLCLPNYDLERTYFCWECEHTHRFYREYLTGEPYSICLLCGEIR